LAIRPRRGPAVAHLASAARRRRLCGLGGASLSPVRPRRRLAVSHLASTPARRRLCGLGGASPSRVPAGSRPFRPGSSWFEAIPAGAHLVPGAPGPVPFGGRRGFLPGSKPLLPGSSWFKASPAGFRLVLGGPFLSGSLPAGLQLVQSPPGRVPFDSKPSRPGWPRRTSLLPIRSRRRLAVAHLASARPRSRLCGLGGGSLSAIRPGRGLAVAHLASARPRCR
jgi:hypothetical protein